MYTFCIENWNEDDRIRTWTIFPIQIQSLFRCHFCVSSLDCLFPRCLFISFDCEISLILTHTTTSTLQFLEAEEGIYIQFRIFARTRIHTIECISSSEPSRRDSAVWLSEWAEGKFIFSVCQKQFVFASISHSKHRTDSLAPNELFARLFLYFSSFVVVAERRGIWNLYVERLRTTLQLDEPEPELVISEIYCSSPISESHQL